MKTAKWITAIIILTTMTSCTFKENIYINENGSGKFSLDADASSIMAMIPKDSVADKPTESIDTTFAFKTMFDAKRDSISKLSKEEQAKLKKFESFTMSIKMSTEKQQFLFGVASEFKNVDELQDAMATMGEIKNLKKSKSGGLPDTDDFGKNNSNLSYSYDGDKFVRKATIDKNLKKVSENDSAMASYKMVYEQSSYIINYHFPKKVKTISNPNAVFSDDRKTITIEYPFMDYILDPEKLNFEVTFEK